MFATIAEIKSANEAAGQYFFEPDTMRFFGSKVGSKVIAGRYFVTSEKQPRVSGDEPEHERRFTIRVALESGAIETVGAFQGYATRAEAERVLTSALSDGPGVYATVEEPDPEHFHFDVQIGALKIGSTTTKAAAEKLAAELRS